MGGIRQKLILPMRDQIWFQLILAANLGRTLASIDDFQNNLRFELRTEIPSRSWHVALLHEHSLTCFSHVSNLRGALQVYPTIKLLNYQTNPGECNCTIIFLLRSSLLPI